MSIRSIGSSNGPTVRDAWQGTCSSCGNTAIVEYQGYDVNNFRECPPVRLCRTCGITVASGLIKLLGELR